MKALLITCLKFELSIKNLLIFIDFFDNKDLSYNSFISLAIASGCSKSEPCSSKRSASLGSSLFLDINQNFLLFSFLSKSIFKIFEYFFSKIFSRSPTDRSVGIVKYFSSSELISLISG